MSLILYNDILQNEIEVFGAVFDKEFSYKVCSDSVKLIFDLPIASVKYCYNNFINLKLCITCKIDYPKSVPDFLFSNYWGLDDCDINDLYKTIRVYLKTNISQPEGLIFNLIQKVNDYVDHNIPKVKCSICLDHFTDPSEVFVTPSHHYFHQMCIGNYAVHQTNDYKELVAEAKQNNKFINDNELPKLNMKCPLCKNEDLVFDSTPQSDLTSWQIKSTEQERDFLSDEILFLMSEMSVNRERQKMAIEQNEIIEGEMQKQQEVLEQDQTKETYRVYNYADNRRGHLVFQRRRSNNYRRRRGFGYQQRNYYSNQHDFAPFNN